MHPCACERERALIAAAQMSYDCAGRISGKCENRGGMKGGCIRGIRRKSRSLVWRGRHDGAADPVAALRAATHTHTPPPSFSVCVYLRKQASSGVLPGVSRKVDNILMTYDLEVQNSPYIETNACSSCIPGGAAAFAASVVMARAGCGECPSRLLQRRGAPRPPSRALAHIICPSGT